MSTTHWSLDQLNALGMHEGWQLKPRNDGSPFYNLELFGSRFASVDDAHDHLCEVGLHFDRGTGDSPEASKHRRALFLIDPTLAMLALVGGIPEADGILDAAPRQYRNHAEAATA